MKLTFQTCKNKQGFPTYWKISQVTPIFREVCKADVTFYRPIGLISGSSKFLTKFTDFLKGSLLENSKFLGIGWKNMGTNIVVSLKQKAVCSNKRQKSLPSKMS